MLFKAIKFVVIYYSRNRKLIVYFLKNWSISSKLLNLYPRAVCITLFLSVLFFHMSLMVSALSKQYSNFGTQFGSFMQGLPRWH